MFSADTFKVLDNPWETNSPGSVQDIIDLHRDADVPVVNAIASAIRPLGCTLASLSSWEDVKLTRGPARPGSNPDAAERHLPSFIRAAR
jgi:hypothetical protein